MAKHKSQICVDVHEAKTLVDAWKANNESIVFTNGCFDIIHKGHITYLEEAATLGTKLIIGLNSDASVKKIKGDHRPIFQQADRAKVMAALGVVDLVVLFNEDTPYDLIATLLPDVLVKGGDYAIQDIVGADLILSRGGLVKSLTLVPGYSTTNIENKLKQDANS